MSQSRLAGMAEVDPEDRKFLGSRCAELTDEFRRLQFALPPGPIPRGMPGAAARSGV
jgi:hypothetical protein